MNKKSKKLLAIAATGFLVFSTTPAFAEENGLGLTVVDDTKAVNQNAETDVNSITSEDGNEATVDQNTEAPSLLPGDFFYFAKTVLEKIKLAFTFDNEEEAKLFTTYASERLAEAEALFKNGEEDKALETIQKALENLDSAGDLAEGGSSTVEEKEENSKVTDDDSTPKDEEASTTEETMTPKTDEETTVEDSYNEVEKLISQNIIALKAALEKVKNPVAKAALQRNIEKSYAKLAKKLEKIEEKYANKDDDSAADVDIPNEIKEEDGTQPSAKAPEVVEPPVIKDEQATEKSVEDERVVESIKKDQKNRVKEVRQEIKEIKQQEKAKQKQVKMEQKQVAKEGKRVEKEIKKQEKQAEKQAKHAEKQQEKKHGQGHSKDQSKKEHGKDK